MTKRRTTSLGTLRANLRYAVLTDGARFTLERAASGSYRRVGGEHGSDAEARAATPEPGIEWRRVGLRGMDPPEEASHAAALRA